MLTAGRSAGGGLREVIGPVGAGASQFTRTTLVDCVSLPERLQAFEGGRGKSI